MAAKLLGWVGVAWAKRELGTDEQKRYAGHAHGHVKKELFASACHRISNAALLVLPRHPQVGRARRRREGAGARGLSRRPRAGTVPGHPRRPGGCGCVLVFVSSEFVNVMWVRHDVASMLLCWHWRKVIQPLAPWPLPSARQLSAPSLLPAGDLHSVHPVAGVEGGTCCPRSTGTSANEHLLHPFPQAT